MPGQSANAALALLPTLRLKSAAELPSNRRSKHLATWLERFTSVVCFAGRDVLLLEIAGSLRLYGGLLSLAAANCRGPRTAGLQRITGHCANTACGDLACKGRAPGLHSGPCNHGAALRSLPLACLDWPPLRCESLAGMGIPTFGDCLRLPREGFARRFGPQRLLELDRALGRLPDPRTSWRAPERFCADYEMTEEQSDREVLLAICRELLLSLERFLLTRQLGTQRLHSVSFICVAPATQLRWVAPSGACQRALV